MIANPESSVILSSLGWVDHDALWRLDPATGNTDTIPLNSGGRYASLHSCGTGRFTVAHHFDGARFEVTVRSFAAPGRIDARAVVAEDGAQLVGDVEPWRDVPLLFTVYLRFAPWKDFVLVRVSPAASAPGVSVQRLAWYDESYDKDYQGVIGVLRVPDTESALVSVQRSSRLVLHDLETGRAQRFIDLANRGGNPTLARRQDGEIWASDYDTMVALRADTWKVIRSRRVQRAAAGTQQFIGDFTFAPDGSCVVARPFSGDIVGLSGTLRITRRAKVGQQPLEVAVLPDDRVVARDWKTGALLEGRLSRRWFTGP